MSSLDVGRLGIAAQALGIAQGAFDETVKYMKQRKQFGKTLDKFQALSFEMASMKVKIDGARYLLYDACNRRDLGLPATVAAAEAKLPLLRSRKLRDQQSSPVPRRLRLHQGLSCGEDVQRRQDNRDI